jgi:hypothetical protein
MGKAVLIISVISFFILNYSCSSKKGAVPSLEETGYPTLFTARQIPATQADTLNISPYRIQFPEGEFNSPVKFEILTGDPANFRAKAPAGNLPILAFAFRATNLGTNEPIEKLTEPITITVNDSNIVAKSNFFNITQNGQFIADSTGLKVKPGEISKPISSLKEGWVICSPGIAY